MTTAEKKTKPKKTEAGQAPAPSFFKRQLLDCQQLNAPRDVIEALLDDSRAYTMAQAKEIIKEFLNRKV